MAHLPLRRTLDLKPLVERISDARVVMLGESTHGTHEFYEWRRLITEWLVVKHGFNLVCVEGDWPPCQTLNEYVTGESFGTAREAVKSFRRWPTWMWANTEILRMSEWLRSHNARVRPHERVRFHGLDVYSLFESIEAIVAKLEKKNAFLARRARNLYSCFDRFDGDERRYARSLHEIPDGCQAEVLEALAEMTSRRDLDFDIEQNARVVRNAEAYYRAMMLGDEESWNVRDSHMLETLELLMQKRGNASRAVVWAHNTHIGDYRATDMRAQGLVNLGGLARERFGRDQVALVGFSTYIGEVIASHAWDGPIEKMTIPPARNGSLEDILHKVRDELTSNVVLVDLAELPRENLLHRAIGVVYDPRHERWGNYVPSRMAERYDALIHVDRSRAIEPLVMGFEKRAVPDTWPRGQ